MYSERDLRKITVQYRYGFLVPRQGAESEKFLLSTYTYKRGNCQEADQWDQFSKS